MNLPPLHQKLRQEQSKPRHVGAGLWHAFLRTIHEASLQTHQNRAWAKEKQATPSSQRPGAVLWHGGQKLKNWCGTGTQLCKAGHTTYPKKAGIQVTKHEALSHHDWFGSKSMQGLTSNFGLDLTAIQPTVTL